jgi:hypothetical protein
MENLLKGQKLELEVIENQSFSQIHESPDTNKNVIC